MDTAALPLERASSHASRNQTELQVMTLVGRLMAAHDLLSTLPDTDIAILGARTQVNVVLSSLRRMVGMDV